MVYRRVERGGKVGSEDEISSRQSQEQYSMNDSDPERKDRRKRHENEITSTERKGEIEEGRGREGLTGRICTRQRKKKGQSTKRDERT